MKASDFPRFEDLPVGTKFMFVRKSGLPHPLGWPDGPWEKTSETAITHVAMTGQEAQAERPRARVRVLPADFKPGRGQERK